MIDMAWALLVEIYRDYGMKFQEAMDELNIRVTDPETPAGKKARAPDDAASMSMLQAMIKDSSFGGPKG